MIRVNKLISQQPISSKYLVYQCVHTERTDFYLCSSDNVRNLQVYFIECAFNTICIVLMHYIMTLLINTANTVQEVLRLD